MYWQVKYIKDKERKKEISKERNIRIKCKATHITENEEDNNSSEEEILLDVINKKWKKQMRRELVKEEQL